MQGIYRSEDGWRVVGATTAAAGLLVLVGVASSGGHAFNTLPTETALPPLTDGLLSGAFVAGAVGAALVTWRRHGGPLAGWIVGTGALVAAQALAVTLLALQLPPPRHPMSFTLLLGAALLGMACVVAPLLRLRRVDHVVDDSFVIGLGMGITAAGFLVLQFPMSQTPRPAMLTLAGVLVATHVATAVLVLRQRGLTPTARALVVATVAVVSSGLAVRWSGLSGTEWELLATLSRAAVGAAWFGYTWTCLQRNAEEDDRRFEAMNSVLVSTTRDQRERMHELRSTMAGLVSGSALLDNADVPAEARERLWRSVRAELDRMERLLAGQQQPTTDIDGDALDRILELQRLKGRRVELQSDGGVVHGRYDALAEVVNILVDNAVTHGGSDTSVVEMVTRDDETVDIRVTDFGRGIAEDQRARIFEWGERASEAPGEGIGLHLAKRLMTEDGGSLELDVATEGTGSSFVISLPAARRSTENDLTVGGSHGWHVAR